MRGKVGDHEGAERLYRQAADTEDTGVLTRLGRLLEGAGDREGAQRLYRRVADAGHAYALEDVGGRNSIERVLLRRGLDADDDLPPFEE
ncbi:hypothetical protein ACIRL2_45290 [Embleya sp. NPDC127516]|uniref:hypothetical protein n=1 Tax=Embleya sp. NPDC127516 TaxID=3363990 RepID=UPI00380F0033